MDWMEAMGFRDKVGEIQQQIGPVFLSTSECRGQGIHAAGAGSSLRGVGSAGWMERVREPHFGDVSPF